MGSAFQTAPDSSQGHRDDAHSPRSLKLPFFTALDGVKNERIRFPGPEDGGTLGSPGFPAPAERSGCWLPKTGWYVTARGFLAHTGSP